jgi:TRAP-type C4-dicarboxylate transport system permease small subunit
LDKRVKPWNRIEEVAGVLLLAFLLIILSYQVGLRFIFHNSNSWSEELARYLFVWFVYMTASFAIFKWAHIRIEALMNVWPKKIRKYVAYLGALIFLTYAVVVCIFGAKYTMDLFATGQVSMGMRIPMWTMYGGIPVCHGAWAIRIIQRLYYTIRYPEEYSLM